MPKKSIPTHKKYSNFVEINKVTKEEATGKFTNPTLRAHKKEKESSKRKKDSTRNKNIWYVKKLGDKKRARREVLAQEFFRLLIPSQPKTRLVECDETNETYVLSKEVENLRELEKIDASEFKPKLLSGEIHGLGEVQIAAMFLMEADLKFGNLVLDKDNKVIKLDGDQCFGRTLKFKTKIDNNNNNNINVTEIHARFDITKNDIAALPNVHDYYPCNWVDYLKQGVASKDNPKFETEQIQNSCDFRAEVNRTILKIITMPDELIMHFIQHYIEDEKDANDLYNLLLKQKYELRYAALQNESFQNYLKSSESSDLKDEFSEYLKTFVTMNSKKLLDDETMVFQINKEFEILRCCTKDPDELSIMHFAASHGLFLKGVDDWSTKTLHQVLLAALDAENDEVVSQLIDRSPKSRIMQTFDGSGNTLAHIAVTKNLPKTLEKLTKKGLDPNALNNFGESPLYLAVAHKNSQATHFLINNHADVTKRYNKGRTVLHDASHYNLTDVIENLIAHGADVNVVDNDGCTPAHLAAIEDHVEPLKILQKHGADFSKKDKNGATPLMKAEVKDKPDVMAYFETLKEAEVANDANDLLYLANFSVVNEFRNNTNSPTSSTQNQNQNRTSQNDATFSNINTTAKSPSSKP